MSSSTPQPTLNPLGPVHHSPLSSKDAVRDVAIGLGIVAIIVLLMGLATWLVLRHRRSTDGPNPPDIPPALMGDKYAVQEGIFIDASNSTKTAFKIEIYPENGLAPFPFTPAPEGGYPKTPPRALTRTPSTESYLVAGGPKTTGTSRLANVEMPEVKEVEVPQIEKGSKKPGWRQFGKKPKKERMSFA